MNWIKRHSFKLDVILYGWLIAIGIVMLVSHSAGAILILPATILLIRSIIRRKAKEALNDNK